MPARKIYKRVIVNVAMATFRTKVVTSRQSFSILVAIEEFQRLVVVFDKDPMARVEAAGYLSF